MNWVYLTLALVAANFLWQLLNQEKKWMSAVERSWFQITAILLVVIAKPWR